MQIIVEEWLGKILIGLGAAKEYQEQKAPEPTPVPTVPPRKKIIAVCSGHSLKEPGAWSKLGAKEEVLNLQQANIIKSQLEKSGYEVRLVAALGDPLVPRGNAAKGCDAFIELHHNSYAGEEDPGTEIFCPSASSAKCRDIAEAVCDNICKAIGSINRGVKINNFTAIRVAQETGCPVVMLVESYFLNPYTQEQAEKRSGVAAMAIAKALENTL